MDGITAEELLAFVRSQRAKKRRNHGAALSLLELAAAEIRRLEVALAAEPGRPVATPPPVVAGELAAAHIAAIRREADGLRNLVERLEARLPAVPSIDVRAADDAATADTNLRAIFADRQDDIHLPEVDPATLRGFFEAEERPLPQDGFRRLG